MRHRETRKIELKPRIQEWGPVREALVPEELRREITADVISVERMKARSPTV
ncbi:MAG: hypothetical protein OYM47_20085 [Gemmatimonadota bacterium]|nr:hypothetical protein [Gemmatimonadota bacterium]